MLEVFRNGTACGTPYCPYPTADYHPRQSDEVRAAAINVLKGKKTSLLFVQANRSQSLEDEEGRAIEREGEKEKKKFQRDDSALRLMVFTAGHPGHLRKVNHHVRAPGYRPLLTHPPPPPTHPPPPLPQAPLSCQA